MTAKGASLLPQDFAVGGGVPDGEYTMKEVSTSLFDYGGKSDTVPALKVVFVDADKTEYEQHYSAGKIQFLTPSDDGKHFVHPTGGDAKISKTSNCAQFIDSLIKAGFPTAGLSNDVSVFGGHRVQVTTIAQPKRPGLADDPGAKEKTITIVTKYLGEAKGAHGVVKPRATTQTPSTAASTASSKTNGAAATDLNGKAVDTVKAILTDAPDRTLSLVKLGSTVMLRLSKAKDPDMASIKKMINPEWLEANSDAGGWATDGESVVLA